MEASGEALVVATAGGTRQGETAIAVGLQQGEEAVVARRCGNDVALEGTVGGGCVELKLNRKSRDSVEVRVELFVAKGKVLSSKVTWRDVKTRQEMGSKHQYPLMGSKHQYPL